MQLLRNQQTIGCPAAVQGFGYWSGRDVRVEFRPGPPDSGIVFYRSDVSSPAPIPATAANRIEIPRRTTVTARGVRVEMIEHAMAALAGLGIDNCQVWVDQEEMPGLDGSALPFVEALDRAKIISQDVPRRRLVIREVTRLGNDDVWIEARPSRTPGLTVKFRLDYGSAGAIGRQSLELTVTPEVFRKQLAASRTFVLKEEADWLRQQGLGQRVTPADLLIFGPDGPIDNELRFPDECVRHKLLDVVGDLALSGCELWGHVIAHRSGHRLNAELVRVLLAEGELVDQRRRSA
ncbi:MAG: UDP-3-O-acyl-N-acetylglucosamine deacetylase [Pirellulales bacterium]